MSQTNHRDYYRSRAEASRDLAQRATDPSVAAIHIEMAIRYDGIATQLDARPDTMQRSAQAA